MKGWCNLYQNTIDRNKTLSDQFEQRVGGVGFADETPDDVLRVIADPDFLEEQQRMAEQGEDERREHDAKLDRVERYVAELMGHLKDAEDVMGAQELVVKLAGEAGLAPWAAARACCVGAAGVRVDPLHERGMQKLAAALDVRLVG